MKDYSEHGSSLGSLEGTAGPALTQQQVSLNTITTDSIALYYVLQVDLFWQQGFLAGVPVLSKADCRWLLCSQF